MGDDIQPTNTMENDIDREPGDMVRDSSNVFQSVRIRPDSILADPPEWEFVKGQFNFVLYFGVIVWTIFFLSTVL